MTMTDFIPGRVFGGPPFDPIDALRKLINEVATATLEIEGKPVRIVHDYDVLITLCDPATGAAVSSARVRNGAFGVWYGMTKQEYAQARRAEYRNADLTVSSGRIIFEGDETQAKAIADLVIKRLKHLIDDPEPSGDDDTDTAPQNV